MDDDCMVTAFVVLDETMAALGQRDDVSSQVGDAAVPTVAIVAARYCQDHLERALQMIRPGCDLSGGLSVSRCNRRLHARAAGCRCC